LWWVIDRVTSKISPIIKSPTQNPRVTESLDQRMIALMRLVLAAAALLVIYLDPAEPDRFVPATYGALILYVVYSLALFAVTSGRRIESLSRWAHWVDVVWFTVLIGLSSGTNSIFFFFYYFSILTASFRCGFAAGVRVTLVSSILFTIVGYLTGQPDVEINRLILRPIAMLGLGYMIAYWGGCEIELRNRLGFLKDITHLSNPRFGVDHIISSAMERFREYYDADKCLLITKGEGGDGYRLRRVGRPGKASAAAGELVGPDIAGIFLSPAPAEVIVQRGGPTPSLQYDLDSDGASRPASLDRALINTLESDSFLSVPLKYRGNWVGRFYVVGAHRNLKHTDPDFVLQGISQVMPLLDNIMLIDRLASDAAAHERDKIARDLHDSVLQPYIGLQLGLASLQQKIERQDADVLQSVNELRNLTAKGIADLRHYAVEIKDGDGGSNSLLSPSIRRFAIRFAQATGIEVNVDAVDDLRINDRLAAELFQMITEGLSNVRRHTEARSAWIVLNQNDEDVTLRIENENLDEKKDELFQPRSLTERAASLGGQLGVHRDDGRTVIDIHIPL
jgi:signal transduction histidine kinase